MTDPKQDNTGGIESGAGTSTVDQAVAQGGAYEVLRRRLVEQGARLRALADGLNARRLQEFGDSRLEVAGRFRVRTEHNCVGRDIVQVGDDLLLFGYNVFLGLKTQTRIEDVFGLYRLVEGPDGYDVAPVDPKDRDRKSTRLNSSHVKISYAVFCLKKKTIYQTGSW